MEKLVQVFKNQKIKVTPQRLSVYKTLMDAKGHLSAEEIYQNVRGKVPGISLGTVYSILEYLCAKGLIQEIKIDFERSLYEIKDGEHHHFLCRLCKSILDIRIDHPCTALKNKEIEGHRIEDFQGYFYGICKNCNGQKRKSTA
ncbi:MAG: transcriptional repressor [Candidatus Omnitrophota bacterium]